MSSFIYCMCTDVVVEILANEYNLDVIAYADDILIGIDNNVDPKTVIARVSELFGLIGLEVN